MVEKWESLSVVMPAFNEEGILENAVLQVLQTLGTLSLDYEIVLVNDKSTDKTGEIAQRLASTYPKIKCIHHEKNLGLGGAFKTGISHSTKDYVILIPIDNPLYPGEIEEYLKRMGVCDIVVGFRNERVGYNWFTRLASFTYNRIFVPLLFNIGLSDVNWIQVYRRNLFSEGIIDFHNTRIFFLVEILVQARRKRLIIAEVPVNMKRRLYGKATAFRMSIIFKTFWDMLTFFMRIRREDKLKSHIK